MAKPRPQKANNYITNIIDSMPSILIGVDPDGTITQWNHEAKKHTDLTAEKAVGQPLEKIIPHLANEIERIKKALKSRQKQVYLKKSRHENGEKIYEDVTIYPLIANGVDGAVIRIDDVTDKIRMEEMMIQSEKMLSIGGLAAGMAHEINNPLAGMMQTANVISSLLNIDLPANKAAAEKSETSMDSIRTFMEVLEIPKMLNRIRESGVRAAKIVADMLSFARKSDSSFSRVNLEELIDQTVSLAENDYDLEKKYDFRKIKIFREYEEDLPLILCESGKIQQVVLNLLRNGAEAMQEAMEKDEIKKPKFILRLAHEHETGLVRMEIEDNGPAMDESVRKRIFEPFFTTKPTGMGTGLGLSVSYFIITENHRGKMTVESTTGHGAKFIIHLPVGDK